MLSQVSGQVYVGYRQFYISDLEAPGDTASSNFWTQSAFDARLAVEQGGIGIATDTYGDIPFTIEVWDAEPKLRLEQFDHIAEASLFLSAGRLAVEGCPDGPTGVELSMGVGWHRIRVNSAGLQANFSEIEYNSDSYLIQIWPAEKAERVVLKKYNPSH